MATIRWVGGAEKVAQVKSYTFAATWTIGDKITFTTGQKQFTYSILSATIDTFGAALAAAYNALSATDYAELVEQTAAYNAATDTLTLTAKTAGKPFSCTVSTNSTTGTINGVAAPNSSSAGTNTVANGGPQSLASARNYSGNTVPVSTDTLIFDWTDDDDDLAVLYDLDALSAVTLTLRRVYASWEAKIGLPAINEDATPYPEYRPRYMVCGVTTDLIGEGEGDGSSRLQFDYGAVQTAANVFQSQEGEDDRPAVILKGTNASNVLNVTKGDVGVAIYGGDVSTLLTVNISYEDDVQNDASVLLGQGVTLGTINKVGGNLNVNSAVATALNHEAGNTTIDGTGNVASLQIQGGTVIYNTSGTLNGNTVVANDGQLNFNFDKRAKTVTNPIDVFGRLDAVVDDNKVVATLIIDYNDLNVPGWGRNVRLTRGVPA